MNLQPFRRNRDGDFQPNARISMASCLRNLSRWTGWVLSLVLAAGCAGSPARTELRKGPYLVYPGEPTTMQVLWQARSTGTATVAWGPGPDCGLDSLRTTELGPDHLHSCTLTGLVPGRLYHYRVTFNGTAFADSFRAAPPDTATRLEFLVYGDSRSDTAAHDEVAARMLAAVDADPRLRTLVISVGDIVSNGDSEEDWDRELFAPEMRHIRRMLAELPFQAVRGNHERSARLMGKYFPYRWVDSCYWSFDYGPAHFVVLDQYVDCTAGSPQYRWLAGDLAATDRPWRFVVLHAPGWSAGGGHGNNEVVQQHLQPLFVRYGVSLVFGGHNHYYARAAVDGVQHLTVGGGGAPLYVPEPDAPKIVVTSRTHSYCRIGIEGKRLRLTALAGEAVIDSFTLDQPEAAGGRETGTGAGAESEGSY